MKEENNRYNQYMNMPDYCTLGAETGPKTIIVRQVLGETETQKIIDLQVRVPHKKPSIEQIVDVFVKNVEVNSVDVIADRVMVRGEFEVKAIYVACLPDQPVHAVEIKHLKFLQDVDILGARRGMDAEATVGVEFVDYDVPEMSRAYKYKYHGDMDDDDDDMDMDMKHHHHHCHDDMDDDDPCDPMEHHHSHMDECHHHHPMPPYDPASACCPPKHMPKPNPPCPPCPSHCDEVCCFREFNVSIMLRIRAKVLADREVQMTPRPNLTSGAAAQPAQPVQPAQPTQPAQTLPTTPKG